MKQIAIADPEMREHREHVIEEIINTEESYVNCLNQAIQYYQVPLQAKAHLIGEDNLRDLFLYLPEVIAVNTALLANMKKFKEKGTLQTNMGGAFKDFIPFLKIYSQYSSNFDKNLKILKKFEADNKIMTELENLRTKINSANQLDLRSYLIQVCII